MLSATNDTAAPTIKLPGSPSTSSLPPTPIEIQPTAPAIPTNITIEPITAATLPSYRRLIITLLPIRYQEKYYSESIADPTPSSLALCAVYHDPQHPSASSSDGGGSRKAEVVAGIQCRLEPIPPPKPNTASTTAPKQIQHPPLSPSLPAQSSHQNLYISTLCTLSPHRSRGIATSLLNHIIHTLLTHPAYAKYTIETLYAHVWEANEEALKWYQQRGFTVDKGLVEGYYRRLRPMGARIVRRGIGVADHIRAKGGGGWEV